MTQRLKKAEQAGAFGVLVADPPWFFRDALPGKTRGASKQYPCMRTRDICRLDLPEMAAASVLFLWRVAAMQADALEVCRLWGFTPKTELVWVKTTRKKGEEGAGRLAFGMGHHTRASHETCIVATRGKVKPLHAGQRSVFFADRGEHSVKPDAFYDLVAAMYAGPRVELFARIERADWTTFGDGVGRHIETAT